MVWGWTCCVGWTSRRAGLLWFSSGSAPIRWMRFWSLHTIGMGGGTTWVQATAMLPWVSTMWPKRWNRFGAGAARSPGSQDNLREAGRSWRLSRIRTGIRLSSWSPAIDCGGYVGLRGEVGAIVGREYLHLCLCKRRAHVWAGRAGWGLPLHRQAVLSDRVRPEGARDAGRLRLFGRILHALRGRYLTALTVAYFAVTSALTALAGSWPTPDKVDIVGLLLALLLAKPLAFAKDWVPFVFLFLAYEYLRGLVPALGWAVHVDVLIQADRLMFGRLPMYILQDLLWVPGRIPFYDWIFTLTYLLHFTLPLGFGLLLWVRDRTQFRRFMVGLVIL